MEQERPNSRPCYSMRLVRPFLAVLRRHPAFPVEVLVPLEQMDPDERIPVASLLELLRGAIELTGDPDIGLKAARELEQGDPGALEYVAASAATGAQAFEVIRRFLRLVNDALTTTLSVEAGYAVLRLDSSVVITRPAADFQSAAIYLISRRRLAGIALPQTEVLFTHPKPADVSEYERTFGSDPCTFDAPFNGFRFAASVLELPLPQADPKLHDVMRRHAEKLLSELPTAHSFTSNVRNLIAAELAGGDPGAENIAKRLHVSARTLARRLEEEGTTFKALLDDLRHRMALRYIGGQDVDISEAAFLLGFSDNSAFYRAFKRWTGETPLSYRHARRG